MSNLTDAETAQLLAVVHKVVPDGVISDLRFSGSCGCYSECTTEPCELRFTVTTKGDTSPKLRGLIYKLVGTWAESNLAYSGCDCCGEDYISIWCYLVPDPTTLSRNG